MSDEHLNTLKSVADAMRLHGGVRHVDFGQKASADFIAALDAAIAALGGGWLPIESAPRDGRCFLTYTPDTDEVFTVDVAYWIEEEECFGKVCCGFDRATHWRPLPAPPSKEG